MQADFYSWGAAEEVTGSKHFIKFQDQVIQVDCGAFQGRRQESEEKNKNWTFEAGDVNALILTHAHYDHSGLIPMMPMKGFKGNIYTTPASRDLASLIMMDSAHIQARDLEYLKKKAKKKGEIFDKQPLYTESDVAESLNHFVTVSYGRPVHIADAIEVTFYDAGHILGSAVPVVTIQKNGESLRIGTAGDLGRKNLPILRDPQPLPDLDYLILESTYGDRLHDPIEMAMEKLAEVVNRTVERQGKIIIPAFAVERTQELIYYLHLLNDQGRIPSIPIYIDSPMATNATSIFRVHQECYDEETRQAFLKHHKNPFGFNALRYTTNVEESKELNQLKEPAIIVASSGMCEAGRILHHLKNNIQNENNTILIVGYMARHTLGRRIKEQHEQVKIFGQKYNLRAEVVNMNTFSAHADYNELLEFVSRLDRNKLKTIFLVHGEPEAQTHLKTQLENKGYTTTIVKYNENYQLQI